MATVPGSLLVSGSQWNFYIGRATYQGKTVLGKVYTGPLIFGLAFWDEGTEVTITDVFDILACQ